MWTNIATTLYFLVAFISLVSTSRRDEVKRLNLYAVHSDTHRTETRVAFGGVMRLDISLTNYGPEAPFTRQISDGQTLIQLIMAQPGVIADCDIVYDKMHLRDFQRKFSKGGTKMRKDSVMKQLSEDSTMQELRELTSVDELADGSALDMNAVQQRCATLHGEQEEDVMNTRQKRAVYFSDMIYPGTKWCGKGNVSTSFEDLGEAREADKCCRGHDHCQYTIEGFENKWDLFNYRFTTLSHCVCDEQFRNCLKGVRNDVADLVGNMYFDVMETSCFVFKPVEVCKRRSWWGRCEEHGNEIKAFMREPLTYL